MRIRFKEPKEERSEWKIYMLGKIKMPYYETWMKYKWYGITFWFWDNYFPDRYKNTNNEKRNP